MPLVFRGGDLLADDAEVLVDPVNCVGIAGAGLAKAFRVRFPAIDGPYRAACRDGSLRPGRCVEVPSGDGRTVVLFPSKRHWRDPSRLDDVVAGLEGLAVLLEEASSAALPLVGCGLGGLRPLEVVPVVEELFAGHACEVRFFAAGVGR